MELLIWLYWISAVRSGTRAECINFKRSEETGPSNWWSGCERWRDPVSGRSHVSKLGTLLWWNVIQPSAPSILRYLGSEPLFLSKRLQEGCHHHCGPLLLWARPTTSTRRVCSRGWENCPLRKWRVWESASRPGNYSPSTVCSPNGRVLWHCSCPTEETSLLQFPCSTNPNCLKRIYTHGYWLKITSSPPNSTIGITTVLPLRPPPYPLTVVLHKYYIHIHIND